MPEFTLWTRFAIAVGGFWCLWSFLRTKRLGAGWLLQRRQCSVSGEAEWRVSWRMVPPSEQLWDGTVARGATAELLYLDGRGIYGCVIHGRVNWILRDFVFLKDSRNWDLMWGYRFHLKICHGMFLTGALFLSTDGRNKWWVKHR